MKNLLKLFLLHVLTFQIALKCKADVSLYFAAHQDDWQLFMGLNAFGDMVAAQSNPNDRVVIFHITAGDAGQSMSYVTAREDCAMNSIRFGANAGTYLGASIVTSNVNVGGHNILCKTYGNVIAYFLRLPDGCFSPNGCTGVGSLEGLYNGSFASLTAVDGSTSYSSWLDLKSTLSLMIGGYNAHNNLYYPGTKIWINHPDINTTYNPGDHPDHFYTGLLALQASNQYCPIFVSFVDYYSNSLPSNLSNDGIENESALFGACTLGLTDGGWGSTWDTQHKSWLDRNYFRIWEANCNIQIDDPWMDKETPNSSKNTGSNNDQKKVSTNNIQVRIYPQPVTDILNIKINSSDSELSIHKIEILDIIVKNSLKSVSQRNFIDISDLKTGIYFAKVYYSENEYSLHKFSKQ